MLAILVIIPEAVALVILSLTTDVWSRVHVAAFVLIATSGFVALSGMASLYATERSGAAWSAALLRVDAALVVGPALAEAARQTGAVLQLRASGRSSRRRWWWCGGWATARRCCWA